MILVYVWDIYDLNMFEILEYYFKKHYHITEFYFTVIILFIYVFII